MLGGNPLNEYVLAFGTDEQGEVYVATKRTLAPSQLGTDGKPTGSIYRIVAVPEPSAWLLASLALAAPLRVRLGDRPRISSRTVTRA